MNGKESKGNVQPPGRSREIKVSVEDFHIHVHIDQPMDVNLILKPLMDAVNKLQIGVNKLMALSQESKDLLAKVDAASTKLAGSQTKISEGLTEVAKDIKELLDKPSTTEAEFREVLGPKVEAIEASAAAIDSSADFLTKLGADTNAPIPPPVEEPPVG